MTRETLSMLWDLFAVFTSGFFLGMLVGEWREDRRSL